MVGQGGVVRWHKWWRRRGGSAVCVVLRNDLSASRVVSQRAALLQPLQCVALVPTTHVCLPPTPTPDQLLHNFKKALELNGRPDVYAPLTEMAALTVKWMEVGHRGGAGRAGTQRMCGAEVVRWRQTLRYP